MDTRFGDGALYSVEVDFASERLFLGTERGAVICTKLVQTGAEGGGVGVIFEVGSFAIAGLTPGG